MMIQRKIKKPKYDKLRKTKHKFSFHEYKKHYPKGSNTRRFYVIAKDHDILKNWADNDLLVRSIISNIGTHLYHLPKHLAHLLPPLSQSEFTVTNTSHFMDKVKEMDIN